MRVDYVDGEGRADSRVLSVVSWDAECTRWHLADVRANRGKGRAGLTRRQREEVVSIGVKDIARVRLHVDF